MFFQSVVALIQTAVTYIFSKVLARNTSVTGLEVLLVALLSILTGISFVYMNVYGSIIIILGVLGINYYFCRKFLFSLGVTSYSLIGLILSDHLATLLEVQVLNITDNSPTAEYTIRHVLIAIVLGFLISYSLSKLVQMLEQRYGLDPLNNPVIVSLGAMTMIVDYISIYVGVFLGNSTGLIQLNLIFFVAYLALTLLIFFFYLNSLRTKYEVKKKEVEYEAMRQYTETMEQQYRELRKFRHDYRNILTSLEDYLVEKDYAGLEAYYLQRIKPSSEHLLINEFKLENLSNIQLRELKSILALKLMSAQELGIDVSLEVKEPIDEVAIDSVVLVRMLGILLDNALEELQDLGGGRLSVVLFADSRSVQIVVQNTCRDNLPQLYHLRQEGFSTKGANRGLGLSNFHEMVRACGNVDSETTVERQLFTQRLAIGLKR